MVLAAHGYPEAPRKGDAIAGLDRVTPERTRTATSSTPAPRCDGDRVVTSGGRVLCVTALGDTVRQAQRARLRSVAEIRFDGMQFRRDIGHRALAPRKG